MHRYVPRVFTMTSWCHRLRERVGGADVDVPGAEKALAPFIFILLVLFKF
jgi:hypothetical protein